MKTLHDDTLKQELIRKYNVSRFFDTSVLPYFELCIFHKNDLIITEGVVSKYLFVFLFGKIKACSVSASGKSIIYGQYTQTRVLGEVNSLWQTPPTLDIVAVEQTYCLAISLSKHRERLFDDNHFLRYVCNQLRRQVVSSDNHLANVTSISTESRLSAFLLQNEQPDHSIIMNLNETADILFTSYRHLFRILDTFCEKEILRKEKTTYYIINRQKLEDYSQDFSDYDFIS